MCEDPGPRGPVPFDLNNPEHRATAEKLCSGPVVRVEYPCGNGGAYIHPDAAEGLLATHRKECRDCEAHELNKLSPGKAQVTVRFVQSHYLEGKVYRKDETLTLRDFRLAYPLIMAGVAVVDRPPAAPDSY